MRRLTLVCASLVACAVLGALMCPTQAGATGPTLVSIRTDAGSYRVGDQFTVEVWVENVSDLYGADVRVGFLPSLLKVLDASTSLPGVQVSPRDDLLYPDFILRQDADNSAGTICYTATQLNPRLPANGSGPLFSLTMEVLAPGVTFVQVTEQMLSTRDGEPIQATIVNARYSLATADGTIHRTMFPLALMAVR